MRVVLVGPVYPYRGGIAHYTSLLYRALVEAGHDVLLVSFSRQYPAWLFPGVGDRDPSGGGIVGVCAQFWLDPANPLTWRRTVERIRAWKPDRVVAQWWSLYWTPAMTYLGWALRVRVGCPIVYICHNVVPHGGGALAEVASRLVLRRVSRFVVQSPTERCRLLRMVPESKVTVQPHPPYAVFTAGRVSRQAARVKLGLAMDSPVILFFGLVRPYKGLQDVVSALPLVVSELPGLRLVVAGEFWEDLSGYESRIEALGVENSVLIHEGYVPNEDVGLYFSAADLLVAPYREVTGSGVVQIAKAFGLPILTTRIGAMVELARSTPDVRLVEPGDSDALASAIIEHFDGLHLKSGRRERGATAITDEQPSGDWMALVDAVLAA